MRYEAVQLLDIEPDLLTGIPADQLAAARRHLVVPGLRLNAGPWTPPNPELLKSVLGVLVVDGLIIRSSWSFDLPDVQLLGPGDIFDAGLFADPATSWSILVAGQLAVLDGRVTLAARRWPRLLCGLAERIFDGHKRECRLASIRSLPRVDQRLLALMSSLGMRWGRVTPDGLAVALPVTHRVLGQLVGARRPTVSLALTTLREQGLLERMDDGRWLLPPDAVDWPTAGIPAIATAVARV